MNRSGRVALAAILLLAGALAARDAQATFIVNIDQVGPNVVATGSGTIDLTGLTPLTSGSSFPQINASAGRVVLGTAALNAIYSAIAGPSNFGSGGSHLPNTATGDLVGIDFFSSATLIVPSGYSSGSPLSDSMVFDGATFASLGLTPGTYTYSWGPSTADDTFVVNIGVPEPSTFAILGVGLLGLGLLRWRKPA